MQSSHGSLWIPMGLVAAHHHSMPCENLRGPEVTSQVRDLKFCHECSPEMGGIHLNLRGGSISKWGIYGNLWVVPQIWDCYFQWVEIYGIEWFFGISSETTTCNWFVHRLLTEAAPNPSASWSRANLGEGFAVSTCSCLDAPECLPKEGLGKHHLIPCMGNLQLDWWSRLFGTYSKIWGYNSHQIECGGKKHEEKETETRNWNGTRLMSTPWIFIILYLFDFTLVCAWCGPPYRSAVCLSILVVKVSYQIRRRIWEYSSEAIPIGMCPRCYGQIGSDRSWGGFLEGNLRIVFFGIVTLSDTIL